MNTQPTSGANRYFLLAIFLVLVFLAFGSSLETNPIWVSITLGVPLEIFHESYEMLALLLVIYLAHRASPTIGILGLAWFTVLHIIELTILSPLDISALLHTAVFLVLAALGIRIISIRNRYEHQMLNITEKLESERSAAFHRAEELIILNGIATIGMEASSEDGLIEDAILLIENALHPDFFNIGIVDNAAGGMRVYKSTRESSQIIPSGTSIANRVLISGHPERISNVSLESDYLEVNPGVRSELCVPLRIKGQTEGVLNIESRRLNAFSETDENLIMNFAVQLTSAIERVRLFQSEQRHAREAETLREAGAIVASTLRQDEAIERILEQLERVVPYDSASVQLLRDGFLEIVGGRGWADPSMVIGIRFPIPGDNPNTIVIQEGRPYILGHARDVHQSFQEGPHSHIQSFLGVPLVIGKQVLGMLSVDNSKPDFFSADHARLVVAFADQVALAIQNARLFGEVEQLASMDGLTGLHNRRHFMAIAHYQFSRAQRHGHPMVLIMLDIDRFKLVNDTYGHAVGDKVLREVAERCKKGVREIDIFARFGGDELLALLLETDLNGAQIVAERLRSSLSDVSIETDRGPIPITISLGLAEWDQNCNDVDDLLARADQALYAAKSAGRNQVASWHA